MSTGSAASDAKGGLDGPYSWLRLALVLVLGTIGSAGMWAPVVVLPVVQIDFAVDRSLVSLPYTLAMIGFAAGNVLIGRIVDRVGIMLPVIGAAATLGLGFLAASVAPSIWLVMIFHLAIGFGCSATFGPVIADISHWFREWRGFAVAVAASGNYFAGAIWPLVMQWPLDAYGWRTTYLLIGLFVMATMIPLGLLLKRRAPIDVQEVGLDGIAHARRVRSIDLSPGALQGLLIVAGIGCCVAMSMPQVHIVAYCVDLGFGIARGSEMLSLMLAGGIISRLLSGVLADHIGGVRTLILGSVFQGLSLILFLPFDGLASLYLVSFVFGLSQGGIVPSYAIIVREYLPAREAGQRVGIVIMATIIGMAFGGWLSGFVYDLTGSYRAAFINGIAWNLLNISIMAVILWRTRRPPAAQAA